MAVAGLFDGIPLWYGLSLAVICYGAALYGTLRVGRLGITLWTASR